jgi:hypothetical protein
MDFTINIYDMYTLDRTRRIIRTSEMRTAVALVNSGVLSHVPLSPSVAISLPTLELYRVLRCRKPSFSVEAFAKVLSDVYMVHLFECMPDSLIHCVLRFRTSLALVTSLEKLLRYICTYSASSMHVSRSCFSKMRHIGE